VSISDEPVRWGVLSTARINDKFLAGAQTAGGAEVLAVASRDGERARAYARERGIPRAYASYEQLLGDDDVQALYIPLPNALHVPWTLRALEAGKHVLCEKPISRRRADAQRVVDRARERELFLSEAFMYRHNPQISRLCALVQEGAIGDLRAVRAHFSFNLTDPRNVRLSAELEGGALMDVGCYCLSATRLLAGEPELVSALAVTSDAGIDMRLVASLRMPGGVLAHFDCGFDFAFRYELEAVGAWGTATLRDPWHGTAPGIELRTDAGEEHVEIEFVDPYRLEVENFSAAVAGREPLLIGPEEIVAQAGAIEALYAAADSGRAVAPGAAPS
jgi:D-xylose 1-dehydrogenase (NADP+, D-xylono-1,5-lactone-forming)